MYKSIIPLLLFILFTGSGCNTKQSTGEVPATGQKPTGTAKKESPAQTNKIKQDDEEDSEEYFLNDNEEFKVIDRIYIRDFSSQHYAILEVGTADDEYGERVKVGKLEIYYVTHEQLFSTFIHNLGYEWEDRNFPSNIRELPYGEQSLIIYEDFNFDGVKDLAIRDGFFSCYSGPSYQIYLADGNTFTHDPDFTRLAQEYCGMFNANHEDKRIYTMTKSGCCWHEFSQFEVVDNKPRLVSTVVNDGFASGIYSHRQTVTTYEEDKVKEENTYFLNPESFISNHEENLVLTFKTTSDKTLLLFSWSGHLCYAYVDDEDVVEFVYPTDPEEPGENENFMFIDDDEGWVITFSNPWAGYAINETDESIRILVTIKGELYEIEGDKSTQQGTLARLKGKTFANMETK